MKNSISILAISFLILLPIFYGCHSVAEKQAVAQAKVDEAEQQLQEIQNDQKAASKKVADAEEWKVFKQEAEIKISNNENRIAELKVKMKKPGTILDPLYAKKIETLEQKNNEMKTKMDAYEKNQSDWETFKREFNHDLDALGQALKDFAVDNKN